MRYLASLAMFLVLTSGCVLVFDDDDGGDDVCLAGAEPASLPAPQRNPDTLSCQSFGGGCAPGCGPCPAVALVAQPSWGFCGSTCDSLSETDCATNTGCRVVKDAACAVSGTCATDFVGCFPTDQLTDPAIDCFAARDGFSCSQSAACTAYHRAPGTALEPEVERTFAMCAPEGQTVGTCYGRVVCLRAPPACPAQTVPGVADGCYTGGCIPLDVCEPSPK
jgi:hypothetical protein